MDMYANWRDYSLLTVIFLWIAPQFLNSDGRVSGDYYLPGGEHCGQRGLGNEYDCVVNNSDTVTIPCGSFFPQERVTFTYYVRENQSILAVELGRYLQWNVSWTDSGIHICCKPNISIGQFDPCYRLNVTYAPLYKALPWNSGTSKYPIISEEYRLTCPLEGNPPATYSWRKFESLDMAKPVELTSDLNFTDDGRTWHVESYSLQDNGMYVCYASNYLGSAQYGDSGLFFLSATACARYQPGNSTMFITPSSKNLQYKPGEDIILNCTFIFEVQFGARPYWYTERNGHIVFCSSPDYEQTSTYDYHSCKWTTILRIMNFSKAVAGRYICGYATHSQEVTLNVEACYQFDEDDLSVHIVVPSNTTYIEGEDVILSCLIANTTREAVVTWTTPTQFECDSNNSTCDSSDYVILSSYDETLCQWTCNLMIKHFNSSLAGEYSCKTGTHIQNITLQAAGINVADRWTGGSPPQTSIITTSTVLPVIAIAVTIPAITVIFLWKRINKRRFSIDRFKEPPSKGFCYDVFISAHDECRELVENMILLPLERDCNPPYIICWHMRNFIAGIPIMEQITDAVYQSRKVVLVFSEHFMESTFCRMELEQAMHRLLTSRTRCLVPIALSEDAVPRELKSKLTYWPLVNVQEENLLERITKLLGDPMPEMGSDSDGDDNAPLVL